MSIVLADGLQRLKPPYYLSTNTHPSTASTFYDSKLAETPAGMGVSALRKLPETLAAGTSRCGDLAGRGETPPRPACGDPAETARGRTMFNPRPASIKPVLWSIFFIRSGS